METLETIVAIVATLLTSLVPTALALAKAIKAKKTAQTEAEHERAKNAITAEIKRLVQDAEVSFKSIDALLKQRGESAGQMKKKSVVSDLKAFCLENGYAWDGAAMDEQIEAEVAFTKAVNGK